ncbi:MAG TPA: hypothetical protein VM492_05620 [Sumerlaeia bacterium]|nr:hypothetical protein [Sumerlaeia bacterium]
MGRSRKKRASSASKRADALCRKLKPHIVQMIERNDPTVAGLDFNTIEANSAAVGDLVAKASMLEALAAQPPPTDAEIAEARREALKNADPDLAAGKKPENLRMTRMQDKERGIRTARGEVRYRRSYLHFPDLKVGIFPPR